MTVRFVSSLLLLAAVLASCSGPVLRSDLLNTGIHNPSMGQLSQDPLQYQGRIFILGGAIVSCTLTETGSLLEAVQIPVDSNGYLKETDPSTGRYLAFYPREFGVLDPLVYRGGRRITLAGKLSGTRLGKIDEMEYTYPYFEAIQVYLWDEGRPADRSVPFPFSIGIGIGVGTRW
jgi:outer membrane lipoprotein